MSGPRIFNPGQSAGALSVFRGQFAPFWTPDGGFAVWVFAGEDLQRGHIITPLQAATALDDHVYKVPISGNEIDGPCGIVYGDAYAYQPVCIVTNGIAYVLPVSTITAARAYYGYCSTAEAGRAEQSATLPAVTQHNRECLHWLKNGTGNGVITKAFVTHFN